MTGMFPDSGVPPSDAANSLADPNTIHCDELWYSTSRCQPRFDPKAANAVLAELINLVNCADVAYDCDKLDNLCKAMKLLVCKVITTCLECSFTDSTNACQLEQMVLVTDVNGCKRLARFNRATAQLGIASTHSVWPIGFDELRPKTPNDPATFYTIPQFQAAWNSNSVNWAVMNDNRLARLTFNVECDYTLVRVRYGGYAPFNPQYNGGFGGITGIFPIFDGNTFARNTDGNMVAAGTFNNFTYAVDLDFYWRFDAGPHTIDFYLMAQTTPPAQAYVTVSPFGVPSWLFYVELWYTGV